jgi:hypothetical protein
MAGEKHDSLVTPRERAEAMVELVDGGDGYLSMRFGGQGPLLWHSGDAGLMRQRRDEMVATLALAIAEAEARGRKQVTADGGFTVPEDIAPGLMRWFADGGGVIQAPPRNFDLSKPPPCPVCGTKCVQPLGRNHWRCEKGHEWVKADNSGMPVVTAAAPPHPTDFTKPDLGLSRDQLDEVMRWATAKGAKKISDAMLGTEPSCPPSGIFAPPGAKSPDEREADSAVRALAETPEGQAGPKGKSYAAVYRDKKTGEVRPVTYVPMHFVTPGSSQQSASDPRCFRCNLAGTPDHFCPEHWKEMRPFFASRRQEETVLACDMLFTRQQVGRLLETEGRAYVPEPEAPPDPPTFCGYPLVKAELPNQLSGVVLGVAPAEDPAPEERKIEFRKWL